MEVRHERAYKEDLTKAGENRKSVKSYWVWFKAYEKPVFVLTCLLGFCPPWCFVFAVYIRFACLLVLMRQPSKVTKSTVYRVRLLGFKPGLCHLPAEGLWVSYFNSLCLIFLTHKMRQKKTDLMRLRLL